MAPPAVCVVLLLDYADENVPTEALILNMMGAVIYDLINICGLLFPCVLCFDFLYFPLCSFYLDRQGLTLIQCS